MTDQSVAQEANAGAKPPAEADGAQKAAQSSQDVLKDILRDFDEPSSSGQTTDASNGAAAGSEGTVTVPASEWNEMKATMKSLSQSTAATNTAEAIREFKGDEFKDVSNNIIQGYLTTRLENDPRLAAAWVSNRRGEVIDAMRNEFREELKPISVEATEDNEALVSAVRGAKTATPEPEKTAAEADAEIANMSDADLEKLKAKLDPTAARRIF